MKNVILSQQKKSDWVFCRKHVFLHFTRNWIPTAGWCGSCHQIVIQNERFHRNFLFIEQKLEKNIIHHKRESNGQFFTTFLLPTGTSTLGVKRMNHLNDHWTIFMKLVFFKYIIDVKIDMRLPLQAREQNWVVCKLQ